MAGERMIIEITRTRNVKETKNLNSELFIFTFKHENEHYSYRYLIPDSVAKRCKGNIEDALYAKARTSLKNDRINKARRAKMKKACQRVSK